MFFVYIHIREDNNEIFYVGKGTCISNSNDFKRKYSRAYSINDRSYLWLKIVSEVNYKVEIAFETDIEEEALKKEKELIYFYKPKLLGGTLINMVNFDEMYSMNKNELIFSIKEKLGYNLTNSVLKNYESPESNEVMKILEKL